MARAQRNRAAIRVAALSILVVFGAAHAFAAEMSDAARREVAQILARIAQSGCEFQRSGTWYPAEKARDHLERKYRYLLARNMIGSTEDFVSMAATRSSMTEELYWIRCPGAPAQTSANWLAAEIKALRSAPDKPAPPGSR